MGTTTPLADKDRIFTNVYGFQSPDLKALVTADRWIDFSGDQPGATASFTAS